MIMDQFKCCKVFSGISYHHRRFSWIDFDLWEHPNKHFGNSVEAWLINFELYEMFFVLFKFVFCISRKKFSLVIEVVLVRILQQVS